MSNFTLAVVIVSGITVAILIAALAALIVASKEDDRYGD